MTYWIFRGKLRSLELKETLFFFFFFRHPICSATDNRGDGSPLWKTHEQSDWREDRSHTVPAFLLLLILLFYFFIILVSGALKLLSLSVCPTTAPRWTICFFVQLKNLIRCWRKDFTHSDTSSITWKLQKQHDCEPKKKETCKCGYVLLCGMIL